MTITSGFEWLAWVSTGLMTGAAIALIFKAIKRRQPGGPTLHLDHYQPLTYVAISQFVADGSLRTSRFLASRTIPAFVVLFLYAAIVVRHSNQVPAYILVPLASASYLVIQWRATLRIRWITDPEKKLRRLGTIALGGVTIFLVILSLVPPSARFLAMAAPSGAGIADGIWTALILTLLLAAFVEIADMRPPRMAPDNADIDRFVAERYENDLRLFGAEIRDAARNNLVALAVHAILIIEQANRPASWRRLERLYVTILRQPATQGVAQVWADRPLTDVESVRICIDKINRALPVEPLAGQSPLSYIFPALSQYNDGPDYPNMVLQVAEVLCRRFPNRFTYTTRFVND